MSPPNRPSAFMGNSRFTSAPSWIRENEVRTQVSGARSAQNDASLMSSAVRHTPLTATLCPLPSSFELRSAAMVMRRFSPRCSMRVMRATSSTIPVNIETSCGNCSLYALRVASGGARYRSTFTLILVRIAQVAFYGEVLAEAVQVNVLDLCCLVHVTEAGACGERD